MDITEAACSPLVTVVMAAYNAEAFVGCAIESVQAQTLQDWELICIDDGSTDATLAVLEEFANFDKRIKVLTQSNAGPAEARRKGYVDGCGDFFIMLDSDDWFANDALERLYTEALDKNADVVVCRAMTQSNEQPGGWESFHGLRGTKEGVVITGGEAFCLTFPWRIHGIGLWRSEVIKSVAVDHENAFNRFNADEYLTRKLFLQCDRVVVGSGEYYIFTNQNSLTRHRTWSHFLSLETDRKLSDLALVSDVSFDCLRRVTRNQRSALLSSIHNWARFGAQGKGGFVFSEIFQSIMHHYRVCRFTRNLGDWVKLIFSIPAYLLKGFVARFDFAKKM